VEFEIVPELTGYGDTHLLRLVLENLIDNAWKFTARRPLAQIQFGMQIQTNGTPAFFVRDNGAGFDMTYAKNLFTPFTRLHRQDDFSGTGIGLATIQRIIHRHGGRVWAEGAVNKFAAFYFTLA
jgi:light-regulated signal transduction histidine kinase (bacteriophytochrome)